MELVTTAEEVNKQEIAPAIQVAQEIQVTDAASMEQAVDLIRGIKEGKAKIEDTFSPHVQAAHKAHKDLLATVKQFTGPVDLAEGLLRRKIGDCAKDTGVTVKGVSLKEKWQLTEKPDDDAMLEIMKKVVKGNLPLGLLKLDEKTALELVKAGVDIPGAKAEDVKSLAIR